MNRLYFTALLVSFLINFILSTAIFKNQFYFEMLGGWALGSVFCSISIALNYAAVGKSLDKFFLLAFGGRILNFICLMAVVSILLLNIRHSTTQTPFILAFFIAYFIFILYDVLRLHVSVNYRS